MGSMALLHQAKLVPTKLELLAAWLPSRPWYQTRAGELERVAAFRFDDPAGEVGIDTMLVSAGGGPLYQVPLTYRGAPLDGADDWLIGTMDHSVLGHRWVYDACGDPVYAAALASAIYAGTGQADEYVEVNGTPERREPAMVVTGSGVPDAEVPVVNQLRRVDDGDPALIVADSVQLAVIRRLDASGGERSGAGAAAGLAGATLASATLSGVWTGQPTPLALAYVAAR